MQDQETQDKQRYKARFEWLDIFDPAFLIGQEEQVIIDDFISKGDLMLFAGPSKSGKLLAMVWMAQSVIYSTPFLGGECGPPVPILYLDYEMKRDYVRNWYERCLGNRDHKLTSKYFKYRCKNGIDGVRGMLPLFLTPEWLEEQTAEIGKSFDTPGIIIVDTLRGAFGNKPGLEPNWENSAGGVGQLLRPVQDFCHASQWACVVLHHMNKSNGVSGSTDMQAACDHVCEFYRDLSADSNVSEWTLNGRFSKKIPKRVATFGDYGFTYQGSLEEWHGRRKEVEARESINRMVGQALGAMRIGQEYSTSQVEELIGAGDKTNRKVKEALKRVVNLKEKGSNLGWIRDEGSDTRFAVLRNSI